MFGKLLTSIAVMSAFALPAQAATIVGSTQGNVAGAFAGPAGTLVDFNGGVVPAGFTLTGGTIFSASAGNAAEPAFSDGSDFLAILGGNTADLQGTTGFNMVSVFIGSIDTYNTLSLLDTAGAVISTFTGSDFIVPANGDQSAPSTNRRITFATSVGDNLIGGVRFASGSNSFELDNVVFANSAVPEPATWAMMISGFGLVGSAMRRRRAVPVLATA